MSVITGNGVDDVERLADKSQEAFITALELFNRPTLKYRVEGCAFFLCNAWELMLKAHLIKRNQGSSIIYYKSKPSRTITLEECLQKVMTNDKDPVRRNIESILDLRNISTHFIVPEYEITYGPLFQANVHNYDEKLREYLGIEISDQIPDNYLILSVNKTDLNEQSLKAKYTPEIVKRLLMEQNAIAEVPDNLKYAQYYHTEVYLSRHGGSSNAVPIRVDKNAEVHARIVNRVEPKNKYNLRAKDIISSINRRLKSENIHFVYKDKLDAKFTKYHLGLFIDCYDMKNDARYAYNTELSSERKRFAYTSDVVKLIFSEIKKDPEHIIAGLLDKKKRMENM